MGLLIHNEARSLVSALIGEGESPKEFFNRIGKPKSKITVDILEWDELDEWQQTALVELAEDIGEPMERDEETGHYTTNLSVDSFDGFSMTVSLGRNHDWYVYRDDDAATNAAIDLAENGIEEGIFSTDFLSRYINTDRLKRDLSSDVEEGIRRDFEDQYSDNESKRDFFLKRGDLDDDDVYGMGTDDDGDEVQVELDVDEGPLAERIDSLSEDYIEAETNSRIEDPIAYLQEIFGDEDGLKQAMELGGIDTRRAATDAVNDDGAANFLASYDGSQIDLRSGAVAFRHN